MQLSRFLHIIGVALVLAFYSNWLLSVRPAPAGATEVLPGTAGDLELVRLAEAERLWRQGDTLFVDVRSASDFEFGHIPGALHLPEPEIEEKLPALRPRLERARTIIVYCKSVDCGKSLWTAIRLRNAGLTQTKIFPEGWNEWVTRGPPSAR
jgi:rhodanese-related sulfurtransferase